MRSLIRLLAVLSLVATGFAHPQFEHLKEAYTARGDALFVALFWLPETRDSVRKHIEEVDQWVGFETEEWRKVPEAKRTAILEEIGEQWDKLDEAALTKTWQRVWDWGNLSLQMNLLTTFLNSEEGILDVAYEEELLRPAFDRVLSARQPGFDPRLIGGSVSSGEMRSLRPALVQRLLDMPEPKRYECFSRLFSKIAAKSLEKSK